MKKTVTPAVLTANQRNAKRSTGPRRMNNVKHNALKHGLLTKTFPFKNEDEEAEFRKFRHELRANLAPEDAVQTMLVEEIAVCWWKIRTATEWQVKEVKARQGGANAVVEAYVEQTGNYSFADWQSHLQSAARSGWELREVTLRVGGSDTKEQNPVGRESKDAVVRQFEARLGSAVETGMRYRNTWKRDLYKALETFMTLKNGRKGHGQS